MIKDNFSTQAKLYKQFRPTYPLDLYQFIFNYVEKFEKAWDCACGNGQVAEILADHFEMVYASDISQKQLDEISTKVNIIPSLSNAIKSNYPDNYFDLVCVAQAVHWFNSAEFNQELRRVAKNNAIIAFWTYALPEFKGINNEQNKDLNDALIHFYKVVIDAYWDSERTLIDDNYEDILFPYHELYNNCKKDRTQIKESTSFSIKVEWDKLHFLKYLETWSSVKKYILKNQSNPILLIEKEVDKYWNSQDSIQIEFPIYLKLGQVQK